MTALAYALQLLNSLPGLIEAGVDVYDMVTQANADLKKMQAEGRDPNADEWATLNAAIEDLRNQRPDVSGE